MHEFSQADCPSVSESVNFGGSKNPVPSAFGPWCPKGGVVKMSRKEYNELVQIDDIPVSAAVKVLRPCRFGTVKGLDESELADAAELERQAFVRDFGPILALPMRSRVNWITPAYDEYLGGYDLGAFGTVDFAGLIPQFNKARHKADKLQQEFESEVIMVDIIKERIPGRGKYLVLKYLKMGIIDLDHIEDCDMHSLARHCLRAWRLQREIKSLRRFS